MKNILILPILIVALGFLLRVSSFQNNIFPHGDVLTHCAVIETLANDGKLLVPFPGIHLYPTVKFSWGYPLEASPPLWLLLGGALRKFFGDCFLVLKTLSLISGTILILLTYVLTKEMFGRKTALFSSLCVALSYLLIDYSGNGAMYSLQADFFLVFLLLINKLPLIKKFSWLILGIVFGLAYLLSYQDIVIAGSTAICLIFLFLQKKYSIKTIFWLGMSFLFGFLVVILPWLWRNFNLFNSPFFNTNFQYAFGKWGIPERIVVKDGELISGYDLSGVYFPNILLEITKSFVGNSYYFLRKILILSPIICFFTFIPFLKKRTLGLWALIGLVISYLGLNFIWPTFKFRFFVPVLPLVFILGAAGIINLSSKITRLIIIGTSLLFLVATSVFIYQSNPFHTYYYDGAITVDQFGSRGEEDFIKQERYLIDVSQFLSTQKDTGAVLTNNTGLYYYARRKIVEGGVNDFLINTYRPTYLVVPRHDIVPIPDGQNWPEIYVNDGFKILRLKNEIN